MKSLSIDLESKNTDLYGNVVWSITYSYDGKKTVRITNPNGVKKSQIPKSLIKDLQDKNVMVIAHNAIFDGMLLAFLFDIWINNVWCTMQCEVVIQAVALPPMKKKSRGPYEQRLYELHGVGLDVVLPRYDLGTLDKEVREAFIDRPLGIPFNKKELLYMDKDVLPLQKLQKMQEYILKRDEVFEVACLENEYTRKRIIAKVNGIGFDPRIWREVAIANGNEYRKRIANLPAEVDNWNSEKQVKAYFRRIGINIPVFKSKSPDVDDLYTMYLKTRNKVLGDFIYAREVAKAVSSYGLSWIDEHHKKFKNYVDPDGRIRPDVTQIKETGRTSMSNPNLQQLPGFGSKDYDKELCLKLIYEALGTSKARPQHRRAFVPRPGYVFVGADFSGQEIGVMAAAAGEDLWINAMLRGDDVHGMTASKLFESEWGEGAEKKCTFPKKCKCPEHVTPRERSKIINFQQAYGGGPSRFSKSTGLPMFDSKLIVARYKRITPNLTRYLDKNARTAVNTGVSYSADPYRRRRVLRGEQKWQIENQGKNNPIQAGGANMLKLAAISIPDRYYSPLEIHDEIWLEVKLAEAVQAAKTLKTIMEKAADYITGIKGLIKAEPKIQMNLMKDLKQCPRITGIKTGEFCYVPK